MADSKPPILPRIRNFLFGSRNKIIILIAFIALLTAVLYFFVQYEQTQNLLKNPSQASDVEAKALVDKVGRLIELPTSENPTIATVSDITKLADQPFFAKAKNGDRVLVYTQSKMLILYRPSSNKIISVGTTNSVPVTQQAETQPASTSSGLSPTPEISKAVSVVIYNGTGTTGLARQASTKVTSKYPNNTVTTGDSVNSDYKKTLVIDMSGKNSQTAKDLATLLGGQVSSTVPNGENKPNSDILIILGADYSGN